MRPRNGPQLPKELRDQIGDPANQAKGGRAKGARRQLNRKDRRKAERAAKKSHKVPQSTKVRRPHLRLNEKRDSDDGGEEDRSNTVDWSDEEPALAPPARTEQKPKKGILKRTVPTAEPPRKQKGNSPSPPPAKPSRAAKDRLAQDDAEIAALEKKLGMKRKKKAEKESDGLDDIFGDLGGFSSDEDTLGGKLPKRKRDRDDEWLANKRRKALGEFQDSESEEEEDPDASQMDSEEELGSDIWDDEESEDGEQATADEEGFGDAGEEDSDLEEDLGSDIPTEAPPPRVRENPYLPPVPAGAAPTAKYVPPAMRGLPSSDAEVVARLRRQVQGLLNKLSEANILSILRDIEQVYQNNARGYVTTCLIDLLITLLADESILIDTFLILHSGFIAAVYKVIGPEFGAQMVERIVSEFDKNYQANKDGGPGKQTTNLISVLAELYCFHVIGSTLIFDYIRMLLDQLSELNTELLLRVVRISGSQLRQDDPTSLKDIVQLLHKSVAQVGKDNLSVRTSFMIETINDLKNNRMKTGVTAAVIVGEHTRTMKKQLGTLNTRNLKGTEPMRVGLSDIRDVEKKGRWWLVGASWRNNMVGDAPKPSTKSDAVEDVDTETLETNDGVDLLQLAREEGMNTDVRRAIFVTVMSACNYKEAHERLLKLNLKKAQELEIPRVIIHCAGCEQTYNPYYAVLARKFCTDHKLRKSFQFALWDIFKKLGEKRDAEDDGSDDEEALEADMTLRRLVNLGKLYGSLIAKGDLSITSLKTLNFPYLKPKTKTLVEVLLATVMLESQKGQKGKRNDKAVLNVFVNADSAPEMITGLQYFIKKVVGRTKILDEGETATVKWASATVMEMLERLRVAMSGQQN